MAPTADLPATQAGAVLGTIAYMSPEQAQGKPADTRSDIFSFGSVLYEMLSGRRAFTGESNYAVMDAIVRGDPPALQASSSLDKIVRQCLAKQTSARYQTMFEVRTALEQVSPERTSVIAAEPQASIAVLPFVNMSGDKEQEYFGDGLTEEIINALTHIPGLKVIARTSAFAFKGKQEDITKIANALRVSTILEGSVRRSGNRIRITAQLITAADGTHLWSERYDREMMDVFAVQDEISHAISEKLRVSLSEDQGLLKRHTENIEAYNLYLRARHHFYKANPENLEKSKSFYEQAVDKDPNYALAYCGIAKLYWYLGFSGLMPSSEAKVECSRAALRALQLDEMLPEAHGILGTVRALEYDWSGAQREFSYALDLGPKSDEVWFNYSWFCLVPMRRLDEAMAAIYGVLERDPLSAFSHHVLGYFHYFRREWDRAMDHLQAALELSSESDTANLFIGLSQIRSGKVEEGIRICQKAQNPFFAKGFLGCAFALAGQPAKAMGIYSELQDQAQKSYVPPSWFAIICFSLGDVDTGFDWLDKAADEYDSQIYFIHADESFNYLHAHPRYQTLLRKMNLEP